VFIGGLTNVGNSCFANAIFQTLASIPSFVDSLDLSCSLSEESPVFDELYNTLSVLKNGSCKLVDTTKLMTAIEHTNPNFNGKIQQDVGEFFLKLLDVNERGMCREIDNPNKDALFSWNMDTSLKPIETSCLWIA
jgi:ubiquitin C-terminal hydrolase